MNGINEWIEKKEIRRRNDMIWNITRGDSKWSKCLKINWKLLKFKFLLKKTDNAAFSTADESWFLQFHNIELLLKWNSKM